jgi:hypothetical protein
MQAGGLRLAEFKFEPKLPPAGAVAPSGGGQVRQVQHPRANVPARARTKALAAARSCPNASASSAPGPRRQCGARRKLKLTRVVAEVAEAPGIQPMFVDPPAAHTILVIKLQNRGLASSDVQSSLRVAVCQYGTRPMPLRHCQLSGCEMATEIRMLKVPFRSVADAD